MLYQSQYKAPIEVYLSEDIVIPSRSEVIVEGKLVKTTTANVGMIESISTRTQEQVIHISHMVAQPKGKTVPLRIMNTSLDPVELTSGRKVAQFLQICYTQIMQTRPTLPELTFISRIILVYYCKCCNLIGYSTRYLFIIR